MTQEAATTSGVLSRMAGVFSRLRKELRELGMELSVWDPTGQLVMSHEPICELCLAINCSGGLASDQARTDLARRVAAEDEPCLGWLSWGCCLLGVPVRERRRLVGVAIACYPPTDMLEEETLGRMCDRLELDRQVTAKLARPLCRHGRAEAEDFLRVVEHLLNNQQAIGSGRKRSHQTRRDLARFD